MHKLLTMLSAACVLALTACAAPQPIPYQPSPRPQIDPLPPSLQLTNLERQLCQRWLLIFSASPQTVHDSCASTTSSPSDTKPAER